MSYQANLQALQAGARVINVTGDTALPATVGPTSTFTCSLISTMNLPTGFIMCKSTQAGLMTLVRYADLAGTVQTSSITQAVTASATAVMNFTNATFNQSALLSFTNSGGTAATISSFMFCFSQ